MKDERIIIEQRDLQLISYVLKSDEIFYEIGYKVLLNKGDRGFIKCSKTNHNGNPKLIYDISKYKSLDMLLPNINPTIFITILRNLIDIVLEVRENGFMQPENVEVNLNKIFIDCNNYEVYLIFLPIINIHNLEESNSIFERQFKDSIVSAIENFKCIENDTVIDLLKLIKNNFCTIETIREAIRDNQSNLSQSMCTGALSCNEALSIDSELNNNAQKNSVNIKNHIESNTNIDTKKKLKEKTKKRGIFNNKFKQKEMNISNADDNGISNELEGGATEILDDLFTTSLKIVGVNTSKKVSLKIDKDEYSIGRKEDLVDGLIQCNNAISKEHCKIIFDCGKYYIVDLDSANGTYVNGKKIPAKQKVEITCGTKIRLANSDFVLERL